ncbi:MAG: NADH-quinone oxidoreductase subunit NuoN [Proteobacteria bacterium]|nr:MAG: NADH-quinone oxidoreductase subunit NuoN [Pseudomonadota bacterium]QKK12213.1 MAG: NADH-quinone oxidoreductase subunit NuoN [Pseudomonadota bacterium]
MNFVIPDFAPAAPEIFLLAMACVVLVVDLFVGERNRNVAYLLSQLTLVMTAIIIVVTFSSTEILTFNNTFVRDPMADVLKLAVFIITAGVFLYSREYLRVRNLLKGEYYVLGLFGVLGMMIMISARNLLTVYLGLETLSLSLYALVAFDRDNRVASEAAMKYFVLGAIASGMLLYGMSMIYGATGTLDIAAVAQSIAAGSILEGNLILVFGTVFIIVGLAFKLGAVPFHMWVPDVYHGAPTSVTLYIGTAPKIAAFAMVMRLLVDGLQGLHGEWQQMLVMLAVLSIGIGNVVAIAQSNIKRMLAYSTIAHVGFILLGILSGTAQGYAASMFYTVVYALTAAGGFGMIILLSRAGYEADELDSFKGLGKRSPWFAFIMLLLMFSMAGVPPTVGFYAKLSVLQAVINADLVWLAVVAVAFSVVGAFYYIRVVKLIYFDAAEDDSAVNPAADVRLMMSANGLAILALGISPGALMALCASVVA